MKKKLLTLFILILITLPTLLPFFNSKFFYTQDYIFIARLNQMSTALSDNYFPVRWVPDLRYGEPLFNFYTPLPYYLGAVVRLLGFNFIWVAKILFILSSILSAITMYIFCREIFSKKGALMAVILYTYAPYRAVDIYVRGALSEAWAFVFLPLIFYTSLRLSQKINLKRISFLSLSLAGLFLTHNVTTLMFLPFLGLFWGYLFMKTRSLKLIGANAAGLVLGLGLAATFVLPALIESQFIQTKYLTVGYFNFRAHFVAYKQLFSTFWGYGSSLWGPVDELSFQIGLANWAILFLAVTLGIIYRKDKKFLFFTIFLMLSFLFSIFLQHNKSTFIWEAIPIMAFIQFPWRFLAISIFIVAIIGGAISDHLKNKFKLVYFVLIIFAVFSSISYFRPKEYVSDSFFDKFLNKEKMHKGIDLTKDYLPIWVETFDDKNILTGPFAKNGKIEVLNFNKKTSVASSQIKVLTDAEIIAPISYFPGWMVSANGNRIKLENPSKDGLIRFRLPEGNYHLKFEFKNTPVRIIADIISLSSLLLLLFVFFEYKRKVK